MTARAYTKRFLCLVTEPGVAVFSNPVPPGYRWVVRCIDFSWWAGSLNTITSVYIHPQVVTITVFFFDQQYQHHQWVGRQVLEAGEQIVVNPGNKAATLITGYELAVA